MSGNYSYFDIAQDDLKAATEMLRAQMYNHATRLCQQYIEKVFKECIHKYGKNGDDLMLLHTHRLAKLATRCGEIVAKLFDKLEMAFFRELTDFYFDTNYPGENYIKVSQEEAQRVFDETQQFKETYESKLCFREDKESELCFREDEN